MAKRLPLRLDDPCEYRAPHNGRWLPGILVELDTFARLCGVRHAGAPSTGPILRMHTSDVRGCALRQRRHLPLPRRRGRATAQEGAHGPFPGGPPAPRASLKQAKAGYGAIAPGPVATHERPLVPLPKPVAPVRAPAYLAWLRSQPCVSCPPPPCGAPAARTEAHHYGPRGVGQRAGDGWAVPLCSACHHHFHKYGTLPRRERGESRELLTQAALQHQVAYLVEQLPDPMRGAERLRLLRVLVGALEGQLQLSEDTQPRRRRAA